MGLAKNRTFTPNGYNLPPPVNTNVAVGLFYKAHHSQSTCLWVVGCARRLFNQNIYNN